MEGHYIFENPYGSLIFEYVFLKKVWRMLRRARVKVGRLYLHKVHDGFNCLPFAYRLFGAVNSLIPGRCI